MGEEAGTGGTKDEEREGKGEGEKILIVLRSPPFTFQVLFAYSWKKHGGIRGSPPALLLHPAFFRFIVEDNWHLCYQG